MKYKPYPAYKDSGVEWLGEVPESWDILPCRAFVVERTAKNDDGGNEYYLSLMAKIGIIPYDEKGDVGNKKPEDLTKCKLVSKGDFVINSMNYGIGSYGVSPYNGVCSPVYIVMSPRHDKVDSGYAFRIFENPAFQSYAQSFGNGILEHRAAINWDILKVIGVGIPPIDEQFIITTFLDRETSKIDTLIAKQEKLIELLQEKRQALISHAVTKGLNPDAPMKDSGVEWLGEVPEHWDVKRLKHLSPMITVGIVVEPSKHYVDEGIPALRSLNIMPGEINLESVVFISPEANQQLSKSKLRNGDLVTVRSGQPGTTAVVPAEMDGFNCIDLIIIRASTKITSKALCWFMNSDGAQHQFNEGAGGAIQQHFNIGMAINLLIPCPPAEEQDNLCAFLDLETAKIDTLIEKSRRSIELMREHRTALISAAVTGKIDVREAVAC